MRTVFLALVMAAAIGCGGGSKKSDTTPPPPPPGGGGDATGGGTYGGGGYGAAGGGGALTEAQCRELVDHAINVMSATATPDEKEQIEQRRQEFIDQAVPQCVEQGTKEMYDCVMKSQTGEEMQKCG